MAITACNSTTKHLDTPIKFIEKPVLPPVASELLTVHERPDRLKNGSTEALLDHSINYGAWCIKEDKQLKDWQSWYEPKQIEIICKRKLLFRLNSGK